MMIIIKHTICITLSLDRVRPFLQCEKFPKENTANSTKPKSGTVDDDDVYFLLYKGKKVLRFMYI